MKPEGHIALNIRELGFPPIVIRRLVKALNYHPFLEVVKVSPEQVSLKFD